MESRLVADPPRPSFPAASSELALLPAVSASPTPTSLFPRPAPSLVTMIDYYSHHSTPSCQQTLRGLFPPLSPKVVLDPVSRFR
jgi:hypothetical protein